MDSLAAAPGTGPATTPLPILRESRKAATFAGLAKDRAIVMGILNVTPDSFSDGGEYNSSDSAISYGLRMLYSGADIIDVGGESTRPGSDPVDPSVEQARILPVIEALVKAGALISVDTRNAATAKLALAAGASMINDVSGIHIDDDMIELLVASKAPYVLMHNRGDSKTMDSLTKYNDVVQDVISELMTVRDRLLAAGVEKESIILDPGLGFSKNSDQNWELMAHLELVVQTGHKVLLGSSRKRFLGSLLTSVGKVASPKERDSATIATTAIAVGKKIWGVRVHDVQGNLDAVKVAEKTSKSLNSTS